jgi:AcrR family transcriptional regulator
MAQGSGSAGSAGRGDVRPAEQRREQLLRAALDVIVARGCADTRIADVAEHAGTSPALVIYYFKTRDQLLTEALRYCEDSWCAAGAQRLEAIPAAAGRLAELIAMTCLPDTDPGARDGKPTEWLLWLDLWALSPRNAGVAAVRREFDERWRKTIEATVQAGQDAGEFAAVIDAGDFATMLSAMLDGLVVQIALEDPDVHPSRAYDLAMRFAAGQLGFGWQPSQAPPAPAKHDQPAHDLAGELDQQAGDVAEVVEGRPG